jgi:ABC-2 type transport system ATP-binding protein
VTEVLELVGLQAVGRRRAGAFSLGMGQRLGIAAALLGDPAVVMLDEPVNGLDPDGILWIRNLLKDLAAEGRTVLLSSHLMSEMEQTAEHLLVIGRGRIMADMPMQQFISQATGNHVHVVTPDGAALRDLVAAPGVTVTSGAPGVLDIEGLSAQEVGIRAASAGVVLYELTPVEPSLEEAFMTMTRDAVEFHGTATHRQEHQPASVGAAHLSDKDA